MFLWRNKIQKYKQVFIEKSALPGAMHTDCLNRDNNHSSRHDMFWLFFFFISYVVSEVLLTSTHKIHFYGDNVNIIPELSTNTPP